MPARTRRMSRRETAGAESSSRTSMVSDEGVLGRLVCRCRISEEGPDDAILQWCCSWEKVTRACRLAISLLIYHDLKHSVEQSQF